MQQRLGQFSSALKTLDHLLTLTNIPSLQLDRAADRMLTGDLAGAAADYQSLKSAPVESWRPYYGLAETALRQDRPAEAMNQFQLCLAQTPPQSAARNLVLQQIRQLQAALSE